MTSDTIKHYAAMIAAQKNPATGRPSSWWRWVLVIVLVGVGIVFAVWFWKLAGKDRRELARLRHEEDVREQDAKNAHADAVALAARGELEKANRIAIESEGRLALARMQREEVEREYEETLAAIDRIRVVDLPWADGQR